MHVITIPPGGRARAHLHEAHESAVPHLPINASADAPVTFVAARTDPNEQESVVLLPELDALAHTNPTAGVVDLESVRR